MRHDPHAALALRRRLLVVEAGLQRRRLQHELATLWSTVHPAPWLAAAAQRWPGLTLATRLVREHRGTAVLLLSMLRLARRWWRRRPAA